ncbi:31766_t:CDS:1, partial [Gigaspora margarita]
ILEDEIGPEDSGRRNRALNMKQDLKFLEDETGPEDSGKRNRA